MNAILRWAGSKRQLLTKLVAHWPGGNARYIEPFCGSACLFFAIRPTEAILGDLNHELIETYSVLRTEFDEVATELQQLKRSKSEYYRIRAQSPEALRPITRAARFLYLNRHCFNGIYRTNKAGVFNVPYGPQKRDTPIDEAALRDAAAELKKAVLIAGDFSATLKHVRQGDFVYLDPPYVVRERRVVAYLILVLSVVASIIEISNHFENDLCPNERRRFGKSILRWVSLVFPNPRLGQRFCMHLHGLVAG
jgi:DNA adenine methylase